MSERERKTVPALRPGLLTEQVGRECVVFDTETNEAHLLAPLAAAVFAQCDGQTRVDDVPALASRALGGPVSIDDVDGALTELDAVGLLGPRPGQSGGLSRRTFIRAGAAAAGATALVTTMATPVAAQASDLKCGAGLRCVSQSDGDDFCGCTNVCAGSGAAVAKCDGFGLGMVPFFDSCECHKCPTTSDPSHEFGDPTVAAFLALCPDPAIADMPCGGGGYPNGGCNDPSKPMDGICVPQSGDSTEQCA